MSTAPLPELTEEAALQVAVEERNRIARALHDSLGYALTISAMQLEKAGALIREEPKEAEALVEGVRGRLVAGLDDLRTTLTSLRELEILASDLQLTLQRLFSEFSATTGILVHARVLKRLPALTGAQTTALFRTAQEAMINSFKHGRPENIWVRLDIEETDLVLEVRDDGQPLSSAASSGFGLAGVKERCDQLGGRLTAVRPAEGGVAVTLRLPIEGENSA